MKHILTILCVLTSFTALAQFPNTHTQSNPYTKEVFNGSVNPKKGLINGRYADTAAANLDYVAGEAGAQIIVGNTVYLRDNTATKWIVAGGYGVIASNITILNDSSISICNGIACDTFSFTNIVVNNFSIVNDSTILVCDGNNVCDTLFIPPTPIAKSYVDSTKIIDGVIYYYINGNANSGGAVTGTSQYQWSVLDSVNNIVSPQQGDVYLVSTSPTGAFVGHENQIAQYDTTAGFTFTSPNIGDLLYNSTTYQVSKWTGTAWIVQPPPLVENWWSRTAWNGAPGQYIQTGAKNSYLTMFGSLNGSSVGLGRQVFTDNPTGGNGNTAVGNSSQYHIRSGAYNNTSVGNYSLWYSVSGHDQVAIGNNAMNTGDKVFSIGLGTNAANNNNTLSISDSTTHLHMKLDSASGVAPSVVGKDANGNWHTYQTPSGGSGSGNTKYLLQGYGTKIDSAGANYTVAVDSAAFKDSLYVGKGITNDTISYPGHNLIKIDSPYVRDTSLNLAGGTTGQVLKKNSSTNGDWSWQDESGGDLSEYYNDIAAITHGFRIFNNTSSKSDSVLISGIDSTTLSDTLKNYASYGSITTPNVLFSTPVALSVTNHLLSGTLTLNNIIGPKVFGRLTGTGQPSYLSSLDSTIVTGLHSEAYYNTKYGSGTGSISAVTGSGNIASSGGSTPNITFTGVLPIANGGTNNGSLSVTAGTIYYGDGSKLIGLAPGTSSQVLHGGTTPSWKDTTASGGSSGWPLNGATGITPVTDFVGTTDAKALLFKTNGTTAIKIDSLTQNVGIGSSFTASTRPAYKLDVAGDVNVASGSAYYITGVSPSQTSKITQANVAANFAFTTFTPASGTNVGQAFEVKPLGTGFNSTIKSEILVDNTTSSDALAIRAGGSTDGFSLSSIAPSRPIWIDASGSQSSVTSNIYFNPTGNTNGNLGLTGIGYNNPTATLQLRPGFSGSGKAPFKFTALVLTTTAASGTGTQVTLTFATQNFIIPAGSVITVSGMTPSGYNGTFAVIASTSTSVTFNNTTTGSQTVAGTVSIAGLLTTPEAGAVEYAPVSTGSTRNYLTGSDGVRGWVSLTFSGTAAPTTTPSAIGDHYIDTTNKKEYVATGTSSSADWTILN